MTNPAPAEQTPPDTVAVDFLTQLAPRPGAARQRVFAALLRSVTQEVASR